MTEIFKKHESIWFSYNYAKCVLKFGRYLDGRIRMDLVEKYSEIPITTATKDVGSFNEFHSKINSEIIIKSWGTNEGLYQALVSNNIIHRKKSMMKIGLNEAHVCELKTNVL